MGGLKSRRMKRREFFLFVINLHTAKALGMAIPTSMQLMADEIIE
jgi:hypothetical protein